MVESMLKTLDQSSIGQNMYLKEAASRLVHIGHQSMETIANLLNVNRASNIISEQGGNAASGQPAASLSANNFAGKYDSKANSRARRITSES